MRGVAMEGLLWIVHATAAERLALLCSPPAQLSCVTHVSERVLPMSPFHTPRRTGIRSNAWCAGAHPTTTIVAAAIECVSL